MESENLRTLYNQIITELRSACFLTPVDQLLTELQSVDCEILDEQLLTEFQTTLPSIGLGTQVDQLQTELHSIGLGASFGPVMKELYSGGIRKRLVQDLTELNDLRVTERQPIVSDIPFVRMMEELQSAVFSAVDSSSSGYIRFG